MTGKAHRNSLQPGYKLHWYTIESILGQGGFGITYLAHDTNLQREVAIKEYLPSELAVRDNNSTIQPISENRAVLYNTGLERFINEARTLAKFKHPNIVPVHAVFEENNTGYMVMTYEHGQSLQEKLSGRKKLNEMEAIKLLYPILDGLETVHAAGFIHRDLKPANIFLREDDSPVLLDFGSARMTLGEETKVITSMVSPGYAPYEQYHSKSDEQGPWTDIYGLAATLYRAVTGISPADAIDRSKAILETSKDIYVSAIEISGEQYTKGFLKVIDHGMQFDYRDRPQNIKKWRQEFINANPADTLSIKLSPTERRTVPGTDHIESQRKKSRSGILILFISLIAAGFILAYEYKSTLTDLLNSVDITGMQEIQEQTVSDEPISTEKIAKLEREEQIRQILESAEKDFQSGRLIEPVGENAFEKYLAVLEIDPSKNQALIGKESIFQVFIKRANEAINTTQFDEAEIMLLKAEVVEPNSTQVRLGRARIIEEQSLLARSVGEQEQKEEEAQRVREAQKKKEEEVRQQRLALERRQEIEEKDRQLELQKQLIEEESQREKQEQMQREKYQQERLDARIAEEKRKQSELQRVAEFNRKLYEGQQSLAENKYDLAVSKFEESLLIMPGNEQASAGLNRSKAIREICTSIIGEWFWFNGGLTIFLDDGTQKGEHKFLPDNHGNWKCIDPAARKFTIRWNNGSSYDLILSGNRSKLSGLNKDGVRISAERKE